MLLRLCLIASLTASAASAASFDDPDWPCIQRKVPNLSIGQMWAGPLVDAKIEALADDADIKNLSTRIALRRTKLEEAEVLVSEFSDAQTSDQNEKLTALFFAAFEKINHDRSAIVAGIGRYAHKQQALTEQIDTRRSEIHDLNAAAEPDFDKIEELEDQLTWDTRIFEDRRQSLTYVCETPVILEQRAFALGRMIMEHLTD